MYQEKLLGERIKILRKERLETTSDMGKNLGLVRTAITNWEVGTTHPSLENLCKLADYFGVTTDYLLGQADDR